MRPGDRGWVLHPDEAAPVEVVFVEWAGGGALVCRVVGRDRETVYLPPTTTLAATAEEVSDVG